MDGGHHYFMLKTESLDNADESEEHRNLLPSLAQEATERNVIKM